MKPDPAAMSIAQADAYVVAAEALAEAARAEHAFWHAKESPRGFGCRLSRAIAKFERAKEAQK